MIRAIIIEDQEANRQYLRDLVESKLSDRVTIVGEAAEIKSGFLLITKLKPDLVFLDIEMPGGTGFDLLDMLREINFAFIITTSHEDFALRAGKFHALDYLLKPVKEYELISTINNLTGKDNLLQSRNHLEIFLQLMHRVNNVSNEVGLPTEEGLVWIKLENIVRCESSYGDTDFYLTDASMITVTYPMKEVELLLEDTNFFRVHDNSIINLQHMRQFYENGIALMNDGSEVEVSILRKPEFKKRAAELKMIFN